MENVLNIKAEARSAVGKKVAKRLRTEGLIPAIIYGGQKESIPISLALDDIKKILKSEKKKNAVLRIRRDEIDVDAMLHDIQYDYLSDNIIHVDLLRIDIDKPVTVNVPVKIKGEPIGVKVEDGIFDFITREVRIRCLVTKIPTTYEVDVTGLHSGSSIKAEDLDLDEDIRLLSDPQTVICAVSAKGKEEVAEEVPEEEEEAAEEAGEKPEKPEKPEEEAKAEAEKEDKDTG